MQASQAMKNRLKEVLGDDRRFIKLPSIHNKTGNSSTRGSTGQTQIITIWLLVVSSFFSNFFIIFIFLNKKSILVKLFLFIFLYPSTKDNLLMIKFLNLPVNRVKNSFIKRRFFLITLVDNTVSKESL